MNWYFNCTIPADLSEYERGGFESEGEAKQAAEDYAVEQFGRLAPFRVRLFVWDDDATGRPSLRRDWPNVQTPVDSGWYEEG